MSKRTYWEYTPEEHAMDYFVGYLQNSEQEHPEQELTARVDQLRLAIARAVIESSNVDLLAKPGIDIWLYNFFESQTLGFMSDSSFGNLVLDNVDLSEVNLNGSYLYGASLTGCDFQRSRLVLTNLESANLSNSTFDLCDLSTARLTGANFRNSSLVRVNLTGSPKTDKEIAPGRWILAQSDKQKQLTAIDFSGADLSGANLRNVIIHNCNFEGAILSGAQVGGAIIPENTLTEAQLSSTIY